jgi:hypothetical protein
MASLAIPTAPAFAVNVLAVAIVAGYLVECLVY